MTFENWRQSVDEHGCARVCAGLHNETAQRLDKVQYVQFIIIKPLTESQTGAALVCIMRLRKNSQMSVYSIFVVYIYKGTEF
jgi:hypothetical protein